MLPTSERNTTAILINHNSENILIDCGEGTQRQFRKAKISPTKVTKLLITHWHGDHVLGLPGFLENLAKNNYNKTLEVYGPKGTKKYINEVYKIFISQCNRINIKIKEISKNGLLFETKDLVVSTHKLEHTAVCYGYSIQEKNRRKINISFTKKFGLSKHPLLGKLQQGKTITYKGKKISPKEGTTLIPGKKLTVILDTKYKKDLIKFADSSDLLISEATLSNELKEEAKQYKHMTPHNAAELAKLSNSKQLVLTHFSQRYKDAKTIEREAKKVFKKTIAAKDFISFSV